MFKLKEEVIGETGNNGKQDVEIMVPFIYLANFRVTLEMSLINCEINSISTWSENCVIKSIAIGQTTTSAITDVKICILVVALSTKDNAKLLQQFISGIKRIINWNKYQSKVATPVQKQYLNYFIDPCFHRVNRIFVLSHEDNLQK